MKVTDSPNNDADRRKVVMKGKGFGDEADLQGFATKIIVLSAKVAKETGQPTRVRKARKGLF